MCSCSFSRIKKCLQPPEQLISDKLKTLRSPIWDRILSYDFKVLLTVEDQIKFMNDFNLKSVQVSTASIFSFFFGAAAFLALTPVRFSLSF